MQAALAQEGHLLAEDLYRLIQTLDPAVFRTGLEQRVRELADAMTARLQTLRRDCAAAFSERETAAVTAFREALDSLSRQLDELRVRLTAGAAQSGNPKREWRRAFKGLQPRYEALRRHLGELPGGSETALPALRGSNFKRSAFHMANGFVALGCLQFLPTWGAQVVAGGFVTFAWTAETVRRFSPAANAALMRAFAPIAHPHEHHRVNSATWYATALIILALSAPLLACSLAVMVLGLADPAAAFVGRRWGKTRLTDGRSLEGTLGFAAVGTVASLAVLALFYSSVAFPTALALAAGAGGVGAFAELLSGRQVDDNLTIPLAVGFAAWGLMAWLGVAY